MAAKASDVIAPGCACQVIRDSSQSHSLCIATSQRLNQSTAEISSAWAAPIQTPRRNWHEKEEFCRNLEEHQEG